MLVGSGQVESGGEFFKETAGSSPMYGRHGMSSDFGKDENCRGFCLTLVSSVCYKTVMGTRT